MFRIHFTKEDLLRTGIARRPDPLWEVVLSLHVLRTRSRDLTLGRWRRHVTGSVPHAHLWRLLELSPPVGYFPDFLTPPGGDRPFDEGLPDVLGTPRSALGAQVRQLVRPGQARPALRRTGWLRGIEGGDAAAMTALEDGLRAYHAHAIAPFWSGMCAATSAYRSTCAEQLAACGLDELLRNLHPRVSWRPPVLEVLDLDAPDLHLEGRGLLLQPSYFCEGAPTKLFDPGDRPVLVLPVPRPATGLGPASDCGEPATALLGRTRASALAATADGCTTSDLARRCGIAVSSASHQATVLREGGLVRTRRDGGSVVHEITDLGCRVLAAL